MKTWIYAAVFALTAGGAALAADPTEIAITYSGGKFSPDKFTVPAGQKVKFVVSNKSAATMEFESDDFHREKVIPANTQATLYVGPLDAGDYGFFDDFHHETGKGTLTAK